MVRNESGKSKPDNEIARRSVCVRLMFGHYFFFFLPAGELDPTGQMRNRIHHGFISTDASPFFSIPFPYGGKESEKQSE